MNGFVSLWPRHLEASSSLFKPLRRHDDGQQQSTKDGSTF